MNQQTETVNEMEPLEIEPDAPKPSCENCIFMEGSQSSPNEIVDKSYFCKRYPPRAMVMPGPMKPSQVVGGQPEISVQITTVFPMTSLASWCGEFDDGLEDEDEDELLPPQ